MDAMTIDIGTERLHSLAAEFEDAVPLMRIGGREEAADKAADTATALRALIAARGLLAEWYAVSADGDTEKHRTMGYCGSRLAAIIGSKP
jgi:hypothetical protein